MFGRGRRGAYFSGENISQEGAVGRIINAYENFNTHSKQ